MHWAAGAWGLLACVSGAVAIGGFAKLGPSHWLGYVGIAGAIAFAALAALSLSRTRELDAQLESVASELDSRKRELQAQLDAGEGRG